LRITLKLRSKKKMSKKRLSKKQRTFINLYLYEDRNQTECAHLAGYKQPGVAAHRLLNGEAYVHVQEEIRKKQAIKNEKYEIRFEKTAEKLAQIRDAALAEGSFNAALGAEVARAKLGGLMVDRKEVKYGRVDQMDRSEVERRLKELLSENQLASLLSEKDKAAFKKLDADQVHLRAEDIESASHAVQEDLDEEFADQVSPGNGLDLDDELELADIEVEELDLNQEVGTDKQEDTKSNPE
jgi:hypothetical protein